MSAAVMTIQRRTWNGARAVLVALVIAVAVLVSLLLIMNNDSSASSPTRSVTPVSQSHADIACGVGHPC
jgi:L-cystine uptake protein TcyP (sodium:dicarboxylate symporter family)